MNDTNNSNYVFYCNRVCCERNFDNNVDTEYISFKLKCWGMKQGFSLFEIENMIAESEAGYYEV